jgi:ABC-type transport system substrate-binding protein
VQVLEWAEFNKRAGGSAHKDCFYYAFINGTWDASYTVQRFRPDFQTFRYFDASGDLLKTIEEYERTFDAKKRKELGAKALTGLHDEAVWLFLWQLDELFGVSKKVKGFKMRPDNFLWVRDTYVEA